MAVRFFNLLINALEQETHIVSSDPDSYTNPLCLHFHLETVNSQMGHYYKEDQLEALYIHLTQYLAHLPENPPDINFACNNLRIKLNNEPTIITKFLDNLS